MSDPTTTATTEACFETIAAHLADALQGGMPPSVLSGGMGNLLSALLHVTQVGHHRNLERLGLLTAQVVTQRLQASMRAEEELAQALVRHRPH